MTDNTYLAFRKIKSLQYLDKRDIDESPEDNPAIGDADDNLFSNDQAIAFADEPAESDYVNIYGRGRVYDPKLAKAFREIWASEDDEEYDI